MKASWGILAAVLIVLTALLLSPLTRDIPAIAQLQGTLGIDTNPLPDFAQYSNVRQKKRAFIDYLHPMVSANNQRLLETRRRLLAMAATPMDQLRYADQSLLRVLRILRGRSRHCRRSTAARILLRVDIVPVHSRCLKPPWSLPGDLALRLEGNNLFGQWCYKAGCGIVPARRGEGQVHEVASFTNIAAAVASYMRNINSHRAYADLRIARAALRASGESISGHAMAEHLLRYSERGHAYVEEIQSMIRINKLATLDQPPLTQS